MKKLISFLLVAVMVSSFMIIPVSAAGTSVPNIYFQGQGEGIYTPPPQEQNVYTVDIPDGYLTEALKACLPPFIDALTKDTKEAWDTYTEALWSYVDPVFGDFFLDKNGEPSDGTHINFSWTQEELNATAAGYGGSYPIRAFNFYMDWRLDPLYVADLFKDYVEGVKKATGSPKVNIICRCEAANVVLSYLTKYGYDSVNCLELYVPSACGVDAVSALFSGNIYIDTDSLTRYKNQELEIEDDIIGELLDSFIEFASDTYILDITSLSLEAILRKTYANSLVHIVRNTYGSLPGIWALVTKDEYAAARKNIFAGCEEEYAGLTEKLDNYNTCVRQRVNEILLDAKAHGVKIANFSKYGDYQIQPFCASNNEVNDSAISLKLETFGATTAPYGKTLSKSYIEAAKKNGTDKYISADKIVDASTALFPDTTWCIFGSGHKAFPDFIHNAMFKFLLADGEMTVFDDPTFPQFTIADNNNNVLIPMVEENAPELEYNDRNPSKINFHDVIMRLLNAIKAFFMNFISSFLNK